MTLIHPGGRSTGIVGVASVAGCCPRCSSQGARMKLGALFCFSTLASAAALAQRSGEEIPGELTAWIKPYAATQTAADGGAVSYYAAGTMLSEGQLGGKKTAAIVFTLEGIQTANGYQQFLSVFWQREGHYVFCCSRTVGGRGDRSVERIRISGESVRLGGKQYVPASDALCCPSKSYVQTIAVRGLKLVDAATQSN
jgi:hypothetical protein